MRNRIRLTFGKKLVILYLCIFTSSYYLTHTLVFALVRNSLLAAAMENEALTSGYVAERLQYYFNLLDSILFMMGAILAVSFFLIYAMNIIPLRRLCNAAKHFSIHQKNEPITLHTSDEFGDLAGALNIIAEDLNNFDDYQRAFISNISHDFRSPLTSIHGYAQAMLDGTIPYEAQE